MTSQGKQYITAEQLLQDSFNLALQIVQSGFRPDFIAGIWRGGTPVGIVVQEVFEFLEIPTDHIAIRTSSYSGIGKRSHVRVHGLEYLERKLNGEVRLLLVDDVYDTGLSLQQVLVELGQLCGRNMPEVKIATPYYKPGNNQTGRVPHYYLHTTSDWLVFPHEILGLNDRELLQQKPGLGEIAITLQSLRDSMTTAK